MIRRSPRPSDQFTVIRNDVLRDSRLSFRARGLLASILSRPDNWTARVTQLMNEGKEGREAIRSALDELKAHGYLVVKQYRNDKGQFVTDQVVYDTPTENGTPLTGNPYTGNRQTDSWDVLEESRRTTEKKKRKEETINNSCSTEVERHSVDPLFAQFWKMYPRKVGKGKAEKAFISALRRASFAEILEGCERFAQERDGEDPQFTAHPTSWLNADRWSDEPDPRYKPKSKQADRLAAAREAIEQERAQAMKELRA